MAKRIALALLLILLILLVGLVVWEPIGTYRAKPPPRRGYDVRIVRDNFGVPHIFGRTDADVSYGLAYAHAEDDFETLEQVLAMTRGRLGAITGKDGAAADFVGHLLGVRATVERDYARQPADVRALLEAYAAGLNRYVERHPGEAGLDGLFPVEGKDIAAGFVLRSPFFFGLDDVIGALSGGEELRPQRGPPLPDAPNVTPAGPKEIEKGSNAFAVAPARSADGATRLVSNAHQPWTGGVAWYEAVVHSGDGWHFAGALFPGSPFPLLGHNRTLGWTNTVNRPDLVDVYKLVLDESGTRYRFGGKWLPLEERRVWLPVRFGPTVVPVPRTIYRSVHGPVLKNGKGAFAIRYAGADQLRMIEQYYRLNKARNFAEWGRAMAIQGVPATNFIYADGAGNIAFFYNALFPDRQPGFAWHRILPGDDPAALWRRSLPFDRVPRLINPPSGYVTNANNTPFLAAGPGSEMNPRAYSPLLGIETDFTNRGLRSVELMEADRSIGEADLHAIKFDTAFSRRSYATTWLRRIAALDLRREPALAEAQALLGRWDWTLDGGPDVLRAAPLWDAAEDGRLKVRHGDSFIMFVSWDRAGRVRSRSIVPFGASSRPDSPHYADQARLFVRHRFKPVRFNPADLKGHVARAYRP